MGSANERWLYSVTSSFISWSNNQNFQWRQIHPSYFFFFSIPHRFFYTKLCYCMFPAWMYWWLVLHKKDGLSLNVCTLILYRSVFRACSKLYSTVSVDWFCFHAWMRCFNVRVISPSCSIKIRKNTYRSDDQVTFELCSNFRFLHVLHSN